MFHRTVASFHAWSRPWAPSNSLAVVQRLMARLLLAGASRVYYSTETWRRYLHPGHGRAAQVLPIPSTIPVAAIGRRASRIFARDATNGRPRRATCRPLRHLWCARRSATARDPARAGGATARREVRLAPIGAGGAGISHPAWLAPQPAVAARAWATGPSRRLHDVAAALRACDVLAQPYPDGITTRRTSAMAGLEHGIATVTTSGELTEPVWAECARRRRSRPAADAPGVRGPHADALLRDPGRARARSDAAAPTSTRRAFQWRTRSPSSGEPPRRRERSAPLDSARRRLCAGSDARIVEGVLQASRRVPRARPRLRHRVCRRDRRAAAAPDRPGGLPMGTPRRPSSAGSNANATTSSTSRAPRASGRVSGSSSCGRCRTSADRTVSSS